MGTYKIVSHSGTGLPLNLATSGTISGRTNINIWSDTGSNDQRWSFTTLGDNQQVKTLNNLSYMLNANTSTWNCDAMTANADAYVKFEKISGDIYRLRMQNNTSRYLAAASSASGANVSWALSDTASNAQKWRVTEVSSPVYPTNFTYSTATKNSILLHIVETPASNIAVVNVKKKDVGIPVPYCGCNGGFFNTAGSTDYQTHNIALNNGTAIGPGTAGTYNTCGVGNIAYVGSQIKCVEAANQSSLASAIGTPLWAQGGGMLYLGDSNWRNKWNFPHSPTNAPSAGRTALVANVSTNKVYLVVTQGGVAKDIIEFRTAIQQYFGISDGVVTNYVGIILDGGGSSCLRVYNSAGQRVGPDTSRPLCQIIYLRA